MLLEISNAGRDDLYSRSSTHGTFIDVDRSVSSEEDIEMEELQKEKENTVKNLVIVHLQDGHIIDAVTEFEALKFRDALVPEFVQMAYSDSDVELVHLAKFVCKFTYFSTGLLAINALYNEMEKNNQLEAKEIVLMYLRIKIMADQSSSNKAKTMALSSKLAPHNLKIMTSLVNEIKNEAFLRPREVLDVATSISNGGQKFMNILVKLYFDQYNLAKFPHLYNFIKIVPLWSNTCYAYSKTWKELRARGNGDSMEALAVWSHASEITKIRRVADAQCLEIANSEAPSYKQTLVSEYNTNIKYARTNNIKELHGKYEMSYFFADYISSLSIYELQNDNFDRVFDAISEIPYSLDKCIAANAVYERFRQSAMLGMFEHFQILWMIKDMKDYSADYAKADAFSKSQCESALQNIPSVYQQMLIPGATADCRLINRHYGEPLYCTSDAHTEHGYRRILTWIPKDDDPDQHWRFEMGGIHSAYWVNNEDRIQMRYIHGTLRGSLKLRDEHTDFFRIDTVDDYILIQPTSRKFKKIVICINSLFELASLARAFAADSGDSIKHNISYEELCQKNINTPAKNNWRS